MPKSLDPIDLIEGLQGEYRRSIMTAFPIADSELRNRIHAILESENSLYREPFIEGVQPFTTKGKLSNLIHHNFLHERIKKLFDESRILYAHQVLALEDFILHNKNIVVASGTGSGKTEAFLLPIIDRLLKENVNVRSRRGIRAILIYPMNALVNDQVKRLTGILLRQGESLNPIRFGYYTSGTESTRRRAIAKLESDLEVDEILRTIVRDALNLPDDTHPDDVKTAARREIPKFQALSREEMWESPPDILVTNYSMLGYMLQRPTERRMFEASHDTFKILVLDEAHTYVGARGAEVSRLIRRVKHAAGIPTSGHMRAILTSASLGTSTGEEDVATYARDLTGETFWSVIRGARASLSERTGTPYALPDGTDWRELALLSDALEKGSDKVSDWQDTVSLLVPVAEIERARQASSGLPQAQRVAGFLWHALARHPWVQAVARLLSDTPRLFDDLAADPSLWGPDLDTDGNGVILPKAREDAKRALAVLLQLGALARRKPDELPALPVRLHLIFKGLDGVFACINPQCPDRPAARDSLTHGYGSLSLTPRSSCEHCKALVIPLATCEHCGFDFAVVKKDEPNGSLVAADPSAMFDSDSQVVVLTRATTPALGVSDDDEDGGEPTDGEGDATSDRHDTHGWVELKHTPQGRWKMEVTREQPRGTNGESMLFRTASPLKKHVRGQSPAPQPTLNYPTKCPNCGAGNPQISRVIRPFRSDADAPPQALINALIPLLDASNDRSDELRENLSRPARARTLVFSDSRQEAAYLAATYGMSVAIQTYRQLIYGAVRREFESDPERPITLRWLREKIKEEFLAVRIRHPHSDEEFHQTSFARNENRAEDRERENRAGRRATSVIMREFCNVGRRRSSLEGLGLVAAHVVVNQETRLEATKALGLPDGAGFVIQVVADIVRLWACTQPPGKADNNAGELFVDLKGKVDASGSLTISLRSDDGGAVRDARVRVFRPRPTKSGLTTYPHRLSDYLTRVLGQPPTAEQWLCLWRAMSDGSVWSRTADPTSWAIEWQKIAVTPGVGLGGWHRCDKCHTLLHLDGETTGDAQWRACWAFRCKGTMRPVPVNEVVPHALEDDTHHLRRRLRSESRLGISVEEHTAQIDTQELQQREARFQRGETQVLSCSTTLELGVDIGELNAVFLRNAPPTAANYQQRAGRAGRRADGVALVAMFAQRRPHDRYHFVQPERLLAGHMDQPSIGPVNNVITRRHLYSELLFAYLTEISGRGVEHITCGQYLGISDESKASDAFPAGDSLANGFGAWLEALERDALIGSIAPKLWDGEAPELRALRDGCTHAIGAWMNDLKETWLALVESYEETREAANAPGLPNADRQRYMRRETGISFEIKKVLGRRLHEDLAHAGVLPVYGFPIDVVPLRTFESGRRGNSEYRLERDRRLALIEYAPGRDLIVSGFSIRSAGLVRPASLEKREWWACKSCGHFWSGPQDDLSDTPESGRNMRERSCEVCNGKGEVRQYRIPRQFTVDLDVRKRPVLHARPPSVAMTDVFLMKRLSDEAVRETPLDRFLEIRLGEQKPLFIANQGLRSKGKRGFQICAKCGRSLEDDSDDQSEAKQSRQRVGRPRPHHDLVTGKSCDGPFAQFDLGHEFKSDLLTLSLRSAHLPDVPLYWLRTEGPLAGRGSTSRPETPESFWQSLLQALLVSGARTIGVPRSDLDGLLMPSISAIGAESGLADIAIFDAVSGGAGYAHLLANRLTDVLREALVHCRDCTCERSCYACLRDRQNERHHEILDRRLVVEALAPLFDALEDDPVALAFAPHARRLPSRRAIAALRSACDGATNSIFQLTSLGLVPASHNQGADISWLDLIEMAARPGHPVELRLIRMPDANDPTGLFQRARVRSLVQLGRISLKLANDERNPPYMTDTVVVVGTPQAGNRAFQTPRNPSPAEGLSDGDLPADGNDRDRWCLDETVDGVNHVRNRLLQSVEHFDHCDNLHDILPPDQYYQEFTRDQYIGTMDNLAKYIHIESIRDQIISVKYSDPYVQTSSCVLLHNLLIYLRVGESVSISIATRFDNRTRDGHRVPGPSEDSLRAVLLPYNIHIPHQFIHHGRYLELTTSSHVFKVIFDSGIDQFEFRGSTLYARSASYAITSRIDGIN